MRVLFVNELAGFKGGVEQYVFSAARGLAERGHACGLAYGRRERDHERYLAPFAHVEASADLGEVAGATPLAAQVARFNPDVVFVHKVARVPAAVFDRSHRVVRMVHDHDLCCPRRHKYFALNGRVCTQPAGWRCWLDGAFIERRAGELHLVSITGRLDEMRRNRAFDEVLVGSAFMADELVMNGFDAGRVTVMAPVIPLDAGTPAPMPLSPHITFVGQLIHGKGVDLLLDALAQMRRRVPATIVGTGNAAQALQAQAAALGLEGWVEFRGWVDHASIGRVYDMSSVVAVPSRWPEPFGLIGLEAMLRERPVVAFDVGGIREWLAHDRTGLLVKAQDTSALAAALERVTSDLGYAQRLGRHGREVAISRFAFDRHLDALEQSLAGVSPAVLAEVC